MSNKYLFPIIPMMEGENMTITGPEDCGDGNYVTIFSNTTKAEYEAYLASLEEAGYEKFADNGDGLANAVYTATYTKDKWAVTVVHVLKPQKTYVSVSFDKPLSERLIYKDEYAAGNIPGAQTKLHMVELWWFGNSFIIQLKNGHFIISDGGQYPDTPYLLDYLEELAPEGEKPVVEAWFISHAHGDHCGIFRELRGANAQRIYVEGIYYNVVGDALYVKDQSTRVDTAFMKWACTGLKNVDGEPTKFYRPHTGQKLYFSDIVIEVVHTHEQLLREVATGDINDTSTWIMINAEGQKCLITGDGEKGCMKTTMATYDREYFDMDMMTLMHHGFNTRDEFTDFCKVKTLIIPMRDRTPARQANENDYVKANVEEYFYWGDGTKVLTFPYTVGSYESLPVKEWIYNNPAERREQINIYRYWRGHHKKEIRTLRINDNGMVKEGAFLYDQIHKHLPLPITQDGMMITLRVDSELQAENGYVMYIEDPTGWIIKATDKNKLQEAIVTFVETAEWTEKGFTAKLKEL